MAIPERKDVKLENTWDLTLLFKDDEEYMKQLSAFDSYIEKASQFNGKLDNQDNIIGCYNFMNEAGIKLEALYQYAALKNNVDGSNADVQKMLAMATSTMTRFSDAVSYVEPQVLANDDAFLEALCENPKFADYRIALSKLMRKKKHILSEKEEKLLAMQSEIAGAPDNIYNTLTNIDFRFQDVQGQPLSQATFIPFLMNENREIRKEAYTKYYQEYNEHLYTIANIYDTQVKQDIFESRARGFSSTRAARLYEDNIDEKVYDNLIDAVHSGFDALHRYYGIRKKLLGVDELRHYDVYVPIVRDVKMVTPYDKAVDTIVKALQPLGEEYVETIHRGITTDRWVDRYENKGKRSGAFSWGTYSSIPYICMNYNEKGVKSMFTLAHEGGHSMHSHYSVANQNFSNYNYTIFEAEIASTCNEQLLNEYIINHAQNDREKAYLINNQLDDIISTLFRQTMFAEYEHQAHVDAEAGIPLTADHLRKIYRNLLEQYFGPEMVFEELSDLEGLRIPHFYSSYYVYKYATGISASMAIANRILNGGVKERDEYLSFLKSGCSRFPLDTVKLAGIDMSTPEPVLSAIDTFRTRLDQFEKLV